MIDRHQHILPAVALDITDLCPRYRPTSLSFRTAEPKPHIATVVVTTYTPASALTAEVAGAQGLPLPLAALCVAAAFSDAVPRPLKSYAGTGPAACTACVRALPCG